ncbi:MAG TPA: EAL domain-containing protein [Acidimicrobiales bacterium]|nr:EAL domain-containing protein [Acidimicrobiales bacterium]
MVTVQDRLAALRDRTESRTVAASSTGSWVATVLLIVATLAAAWALTYLAGGSKSALPHAFYVPIVVAAVRFGSRAAGAAAIAAGLAVGPLMPLDVAAGEAQTLDNWLTRMAIFVVVGLFTAYLCRHSLGALAAEVTARRFRRELEAAIADGQLAVVYQPVVDLADGSLAGAEVLARWDHPERGSLPPGQFVCQAEQAGCIGTLTRFVLAEACEQVARWRADRLADRERFSLAVNVSGQDLADPCFAGTVAEVLARTGLPSSWLHLEITETALVDDVESAIAAVTELRGAGVRIAVDDFGTGESSLGYLDRFPVDVLKIDSVFVRRLSAAAADDALTHGIVAMAHAMDLEVVAEGVETEAQALAVRRFGCPYAQGFLFSPPVLADRLEAMLASSRPFPLPTP